jgi:hypothetical protein
MLLQAHLSYDAAQIDTFVPCMNLQLQTGSQAGDTPEAACCSHHCSHSGLRPCSQAVQTSLVLTINVWIPYNIIRKAAAGQLGCQSL